MIRRLGLPLAFLALFAIAGGHWAVLQTVAWTRMVVAYSQKDGLEEGVAKTFDGAHPCPLCMKVEAGKKQEEKAPATTVDAKKKGDPFPLAASWPVSRPSGLSLSWAHDPLNGAARSDRPPVPPPPSLRA